jgi:hypothetical protein
MRECEDCREFHPATFPIGLAAHTTSLMVSLSNHGMTVLQSEEANPV